MSITMGGHSAYLERTVHYRGQRVILRSHLQYNKSKQRLLDTWDRNGSTSGPTPWQINDDDDDDKSKLNWFNRFYLQDMKLQKLHLIHTGVFKISVLIGALLLIRVRQRPLIKRYAWIELQNNWCCTRRRDKRKYRPLDALGLVCW
jgi:hypothetical protein